MKIAIITRPEDRSPKVLALGLQAMLNKLGLESAIFYETGTLIRMQPLWQKLKFPYSFLKRLYSKLKFFKEEQSLLRALESYDVIVFSECTPNGFWKGYYAIEQLRAKLRKPILFYEVYYLGNAPTQIKRLMDEQEPGLERYDWHLAVADTTEIKSTPGHQWSRIGLNIAHTGLQPTVKKSFLVVVDFEQAGYEQYRKDQIEVLQELGISYLSLEGSYRMEEIREIYRQSCVLLIQFPEAFGLPIAECFACGSYVMTPSSSWPMSWRLDPEPQVHSEGSLPDCFVVYSSKEELRSKLTWLRASYDLEATAEQVYSTFLSHYPHYYYGDNEALRGTLKTIEKSYNK